MYEPSGPSKKIALGTVAYYTSPLIYSYVTNMKIISKQKLFSLRLYAIMRTHSNPSHAQNMIHDLLTHRIFKCDLIN